MATKQQAIGFWNGLPAIAKGIIVIGTLAGGYFLYKYIRKNSKTNKDVKEVKGELEASVQSGTRPTLTPTQATMVANGLYNSMDGYNYLWQIDTDVDKFRSNFWQIINKADLLLVISKFGNREGADLKKWMDTEWVGGQKLQKIANSHLESQGIDYRF
jgi:hypothetical protein